MHRLALLGLNHGTAPLSLREKLAFNAAHRRRLWRRLGRASGERSGAALDVQSRGAVCGDGGDCSPSGEELLAFLGAARGMEADQVSGARLSEERSGRGGASVYRCVVAGFDGAGESQILGQVREAYDCARESNVTGALLNPLFQRAIAVGKQVMTETSIGSGRLSVASVAVDYARRISIILMTRRF